MPSDHSSIAARHRARTLSRAKSLRKHERWLVQQHDRHQSQPNLHKTDFEQQYSSGSLLRRATSLGLQRSRGTSASDATGFNNSIPSPFASSTALVNALSPFTPLTEASLSGSGFPWNEVDWNRSRKKLGLSSGIARALNPYPATTTQQVSTATAKCTSTFSAGDLDATTHLGQQWRRYSPKPVVPYSTTLIGPKAASSAQPASPFSSPRPTSQDNTSTFTNTDSNTTSSSQVSDSDALRHLYVTNMSGNANTRLMSLPRAKTYSHPTQTPQEQSNREEKRPLMPSTPHTQAENAGRDRSPQRHQRSRHPQLIFPYAPGSMHGVPAHGKSPSKALHHRHHHHPLQGTHQPSTIKVRRFIDGYCGWISVPNVSQHDANTQPMLAPPKDKASSADGDEIAYFIPGKTIWTRTRSSIPSLASTIHLKTGIGTKIAALGGKLSFWPAGPRRLMFP